MAKIFITLTNPLVNYQFKTTSGENSNQSVMIFKRLVKSAFYGVYAHLVVNKGSPPTQRRDLLDYEIDIFIKKQFDIVLSEQDTEKLNNAFFLN